MPRNTAGPCEIAYKKNNLCNYRLASTPVHLLHFHNIVARFSSVVERLDEVENIDLISCLNVLDRCAEPHQILSDIHRALSPNGRAVVALVLPYSHYVETSKFSHLARARILYSNEIAHFRHFSFTDKTIIAGLAELQFVTIRSGGEILFRGIGIDGIHD